MIASLQGNVTHIGPDHVVLEVGGVGYLVYLIGPTVQSLRPGAALQLLTHQVVREDSLTLYGFKVREELELFQQLIRVNGVGPRLALETLSTHSPDVLSRAVINKQDSVFAQVSGIGSKTAQKIILALEDRLPFTEEMKMSPETAGIHGEVQEALIALGYSVLEAQAALQTIPEDSPLDLESRLTIALKYFS